MSPDAFWKIIHVQILYIQKIQDPIIQMLFAQHPKYILNNMSLSETDTTQIQE